MTDYTRDQGPTPEEVDVVPGRETESPAFRALSPAGARCRFSKTERGRALRDRCDPDPARRDPRPRRDLAFRATPERPGALPRRPRLVLRARPASARAIRRGRRRFFHEAGPRGGDLRPRHAERWARASKAGSRAGRSRARAILAGPAAPTIADIAAFPAAALAVDWGEGAGGLTPRTRLWTRRPARAAGVSDDAGGAGPPVSPSGRPCGLARHRRAYAPRRGRYSHSPGRPARCASTTTLSAALLDEGVRKGRPDGDGHVSPSSATRCASTSPRAFPARHDEEAAHPLDRARAALVPSAGDHQRGARSRRSGSRSGRVGGRGGRARDRSYGKQWRSWREARRPARWTRSRGS